MINDHPTLPHCTDYVYTVRTCTCMCGDRLSQTLNVYWEKTPESVLYRAVQAAVDNMDDIQLVDFTSTENVSLSHLPGN